MCMQNNESNVMILVLKNMECHWSTTTKSEGRNAWLLAIHLPEVPDKDGTDPTLQPMEEPG